MTHAFLDVGFTYRAVKDEIDAALARVLGSGMYIGGPAVERFERAFADYCEVKHCIGVGNGLDALVLILRAAGIGPGDEVIVPANTFIATWLAVTQVGATPTPVDADPATMNLDLARVSDALSPRTRAIMPVHLYGAPTPMAELRALAAAHDLLVIEDAAQAQGARDGGRRTGGLGHAAGFSFYPGKNLGAFGDAGAVTTNDDALADRIRMFGNYGSRVKYQHDIMGCNSRLDPLQAAVLEAKLSVLDTWNARRGEIAAVYTEQLRDIPGLRLPQIAPGSESVWHLYVVRHPDRDRLRQVLAEKGVATALHYPIPNHMSGAFVDAFGGRTFPVTEEICRTCLSLPIGPHLDVGAARQIAGVIREVASLAAA